MIVRRLSHSPPIHVPLEAAAALFLERQHLDRPRGRRLSADRLLRFVTDAGGIQLDTINVVERAHHLTLWSRYGPYDRGAFDRIAYEEKLLFEYWAHAACLVPASHFRHWRQVMRSYAERPRYRQWADWARRNRGTLEAVEGAIRERGPLASVHFAHPRPGKRGGWWDRKPATHALDYLWMSGRLLVASRRHFQKHFDLAERVFPETAISDPPDLASFRRWHLRQSLHAMGAATAADLRAYLSFPPQTQTDRREAIAAMLASGELVALRVGPRRRGAEALAAFALAEDLPALARAARRRVGSRGTTLLSPFDSLLWHRERVRQLFGFEYKIQVYTPVGERRHGYYLMPILHDGQLIGRLDAKTRREESRLEVKAVHFEPWFAKGLPPPAATWGLVDPDQALAGLADTIASLAGFVGAERIGLGRVEPRRLGAPLRAALRRIS